MTVTLMQVLNGVAIVVAVITVWYAFGFGWCVGRRKEGLLLLVLAALVFAPALVAGQSRPAAGLPEPDFPGLIDSLKATPGCLGVEPVGTPAGKRAIFAWFEDKRALMRWYSSEAHLRAVQAVFPGYQLRGTTLKELPDNTGPILAIASITLADRAQTGEGAPPFKQISIEYYTPLAGGIFVGGRFAPADVKVPGMREISLPAAGEPRK